MRIDIMTLFPEMCERVMGESIIGRARANNVIEVNCHQIRDFAFDKHSRVDDTVYGGGMGMLMMAEPIYQCFYHICGITTSRPHLIYMSPKGAVLTQERAKELSKLENIAILCGHYEGVDQRVLDELVDEQISIGDYVLTGGELPALVLSDVIARMIPGVLSEEECFTEESHYDGLLEYPQYTKPYEWHGRTVPDELLTGDHNAIADWRRTQAIAETCKHRPDLIKTAPLTDRERRMAARLLENDD